MYRGFPTCCPNLLHDDCVEVQSEICASRFRESGVGEAECGQGLCPALCAVFRSVTWPLLNVMGTCDLCLLFDFRYL